MSGGPGAGRASNGLGGGRGGLSTQLHMGGVGRQSQQNDKRQSLGLAFPGGEGLGGRQLQPVQPNGAKALRCSRVIACTQTCAGNHSTGTLGTM